MDILNWSSISYLFFFFVFYISVLKFYDSMFWKISSVLASILLIWFATISICFFKAFIWYFYFIYYSYFDFDVFILFILYWMVYSIIDALFSQIFKNSLRAILFFSRAISICSWCSCLSTCNSYHNYLITYYLITWSFLLLFHLFTLNTKFLWICSSK